MSKEPYKHISNHITFFYKLLPEKNNMTKIITNKREK